MNNKRTIRVPFGLLNIAGLMKTEQVLNGNVPVGAEVTVPLYCNETYKIKPTFNRKLIENVKDIEEYADIMDYAMMPDGFYYQKKFRRMVLWDFGDGNTAEGYSIEHAYEKPGRYNISCTFYDINRAAWKNTYYITVVVKELLPTQLKFEKDFTKTSIKCSKIEQIARLEATLSCNCKEDLQVQAKRIFSEQEVDNNYQEIGRSYTEIPNEIFKFSRKYWTFLENEQTLLFQSDQIHSENLIPRDLYTPNYISLYGKFYYDTKDEEEPIKVAIYQVIPYKNIDENLKTIRVLNPNCKISDILSHGKNEGEDYQDYLNKFTKVIDITQVYTQEQLPQYVSYIGKRAWVDIFYKNDYLGNDNNFSFFYDIEHKNITKELLTSDNYLNINPIGMKLNIIGNDYSQLKVGVSLDGFLRNLSDKGYTIDEYLENGLIKGIDLDFYFFPYIEYGNGAVVLEGTDIELWQEEEISYKNSITDYYVPKDVTIVHVTPTQMVEKGSSEWMGSGKLGQEAITDWLWRLRFSLGDNFLFSFTVQFDDGSSKEIEIIKNKLIDPDNIVIPTEKMVREDITKLVDVYMSHPMFNETSNVKDFFKIILNGNNLINYTLTKSNHFLDDNANVRTCYLSSLISTLKMMGEDILEYEKGGFEGVNELRDFVRILSMNHTDLVGHVIKKPYDIVIQNDRKGKNVGDKILLTDKLTISNGKIKKVTRNGKVYDYTKWDSDGVLLIVQDKYTYQTKIVNCDLCGSNEIYLKNYRPSWCWNLLLPSKYDECLERFKAENGGDALGERDRERINKSIEQLVDGYYSFYILNPDVDTKRIGNFLDEYTITENIDNPEKWNEKWGITHEILMKIFRDSGNLKNTKILVENDDEISTFKMSRMLNDDEIGMVDTVITVQGSVYKDRLLDYDKHFRGDLQIIGCIYGKGEHTLEMKFINGEVDGVPIKTVEDYLSFTITVNDDLTIHPTKQVFDISGGEYKGTLNVKLCGKIRKRNNKLEGLLWDAYADVFSQ